MIGGEPVAAKDRRVHREILYAMESVRSRLAVAIAAENKATPRERWRHYLETQERMRRCVRDIRMHAGRNSCRQVTWLQALSLLKQPRPVGDRRSHGEAHQLCQRLYEVLSIIEDTSKDRTSDE